MQKQKRNFINIQKFIFNTAKTNPPTIGANIEDIEFVDWDIEFILDIFLSETILGIELVIATLKKCLL